MADGEDTAAGREPADDVVVPVSAVPGPWRRRSASPRGGAAAATDLLTEDDLLTEAAVPGPWRRHLNTDIGRSWPVPAPGEPFVLTVGQDVVERERPADGWRALVCRLSRGQVNPGPSRAERDRRARLRRITAPVRGPRTVAVIGLKGGVGRTTLVALLGRVLAERRDDQIAVVDANPDAGTLADRLLERRAATTLSDVIHHLPVASTAVDLSPWVERDGRLTLIAADEDPSTDDAGASAQHLRELVALLRRSCSVTIIDCASGVTHPIIRAALEVADTVVVVGAATPDAGSRASRTLDWLTAEGGHSRRLAAAAVVALCGDRSSPRIDHAAVRAHFQQRAGTVVEIPADPHLAAGGPLRWDQLRSATQVAALELAACVADRLSASSP